MPLISVIMPTYNHASFIKEALDSIKKQTFRDYEIIVIDDGSTDNTKEILENYAGIRYLLLEHGGVAAARNAALKVAGGKWIAFLDSDDLWKEDKLQKQVDYLHLHPECRIVYTKFSNFTDIPEDKMDERQKELLQGDDRSWHLTSALVDVRLFDEIGLFDRKLKCHSDTEWNFRLKFYKVNMNHCINEVLYLRRVHNTNISNARRELYSTDIRDLALDAYKKIRRIK